MELFPKSEEMRMQPFISHLVDKELNLVSWNGGEPKYDIHDWAPDQEKMGKGVTLTDEEAAILVTVLKKRIK